MNRFNWWYLEQCRNTDGIFTGFCYVIAMLLSSYVTMLSPSVLPSWRHESLPTQTGQTIFLSNLMKLLANDTVYTFVHIPKVFLPTDIIVNNGLGKSQQAYFISDLRSKILIISRRVPSLTASSHCGVWLVDGPLASSLIVHFSSVFFVILAYEL